MLLEKRYKILSQPREEVLLLKEERSNEKKKETKTYIEELWKEEMKQLSR